MREDFLHYLWRLRRFDHQELQSTDAETLEILAVGEHNHHAGPDFLNVRIRIGDTTWAGNMEMHILASDWLRHGHQNDPSYDNVVIHVVYEEDVPLYKANGERIPCLVLKDRIPAGIFQQYHALIHNEYWIACQGQLDRVSSITKSTWMHRLLIERLEQKTQAVSDILTHTNNNWEETMYRLVARSFGLKINTEPFEQLARSLPLNTLAKYKNNLFQIEALLLGQSGLLHEGLTDEYPKSLWKEYQYLQQKHQLTPLYASQWKFARLRPASFPTLRVAQFAQLIFQEVHLFSKTLEAPDARALETLFDVQLNDGYWLTHYNFEQSSVAKPKSLGKDAIQRLLINTVAPILFLYGAQKADDSYKEKSLNLLESLDAESNSIITQWEALGMNAQNAYQSQALLQLKKQYCDPKRCMECSICHAILKE